MMSSSPSFSVLTAISSLEESFCRMCTISACLPGSGGRILFSVAMEIGSGFEAAIFDLETSRQHFFEAFTLHRRRMPAD